MSERIETNVTTQEKMRKNVERHKQRVAEIRADRMLSDEAKRLELGELYSKARSTYDQLTDEYRSGIRERLRESRKAAFAIPKIVGADKAMELLAYRSALDSVAMTKDARELSELLARAETTGDTPLARSVLYRGYALQNEGLVGAYLEKYPEERVVWEEFMDSAQKHNTLENLGISGAVGVPEPEPPQELRGAGVSGNEAGGGGRR
jgi:hypothetical protein